MDNRTFSAGENDVLFKAIIVKRRLPVLTVTCVAMPSGSNRPGDAAGRGDLKMLKGLTPYEFICKRWTSEPDRYILTPIHQMPGLNN